MNSLKPNANTQLLEFIKLHHTLTTKLSAFKEYKDRLSQSPHSCDLLIRKIKLK